jgi:hypothetical protein
MKLVLSMPPTLLHNDESIDGSPKSLGEPNLSILIDVDCAYCTSVYDYERFGLTLYKVYKHYGHETLA